MNEAQMATETKQHLPLRIDRMPDGGFVVSETPSMGDNGRFCASLFASTSIGEALEFIARRLDPAALAATKAAEPAKGTPRRCSRCYSPFARVNAGADWSGL